MTVTEARPTTVIGQRLLRREDPALLTGEARFTADLDIPGALFLAVVRSPYAHARITSVDTSAAAGADGVVAVYTGADLADAWAAPMPCAWPVTDDMKNPPHYPLATDKVCYVGDGVAAVVATSESAARDAAELVEVEYEPLEAVIDLEDALSDRVVIHDDLGTNRSYTWSLKVEGTEGQIDAAFAAAAHTVKERYVQQRLIPMAMETRAVVAVPQPFGGDLTLYSTTQIPHILKIMSAITLGLGEQQVRVVAPSVGGGFGSKLNVYAEELLCMALAKRHGVAVRWNESRTENALATIHGRGQIQDIELAADADGKLTAVRVRLLADMGAYLQLVTPGIPLLGAFLYAGVYDLPAAYDFECTSVFTTMTPTDAYRGAGRPEATYAIERAMDSLAAKIGVDPLELRRRNYIPTASYPYTAWSGLVYDSADHPAAADKAAAMIGYDALRQRQQTQNVDGATKRLGIGVSSYFEMCGLAPSRVLASLNYSAGGWEAATVRVLPTAKVQVVTGSAPHGQGHETAWSMIVAEQLGISPDDVDVLHSDTAIAPLGMDTYGSRSLPVGGVAIAMACDRVVDKAKQIAAHQLEASADDLNFEGGAFTVAGSPDKSMPLAAIAFEAFTAHNLPDGMEPNLEAHVTYDPPNFSWPFGTHMCAVEVDTETGARRRPRLRRRRRLRRAGQPADRRGAGARRRDPGSRPGAVRGGGVRLGRQPADVDPRRVSRAGGERRAVAEARPHGHPVADQSARCQGHRRGRHDRRRSGGDQRRRRRPVRARRQGRADAGEPAQRLEGDPRRRRGHRTRPHRPRRPPRRHRPHDHRPPRRRDDRHGGRSAMIPAAFDYVRASSAEEAISLVGQHGDDAKFLAGGHSLLPLMKLRLAQPAVLVDIGRIADLSYIRDDGDHIAIGALTRHRDVETSALLAEHVPLLAHAASHVGDPPGPPSRHDRRVDRPRRSGQRPAGDDAGARRDVRRPGSRRNPGDPGRRLLPGVPDVGPGSRRTAHRDPRAEDERRRMGLPEVQPARPGLGDRRRGGVAAQR